MSRLDDLRKEYEEADAAAVKLSGEYQEKVDKQVTAKWMELKDRYSDRIDEANEKARTAQQAYLDAEAASALLDDPDAETKLAGFTGEGGDRIRAAYKELAS